MKKLLFSIIVAVNITTSIFAVCAPGTALQFDGVDDYVEIPDADSLTPTNQITIAYWIYKRSGQNAGIYKFASCPGEPSSPSNSRAYYLTIDDGTSEVVLSIWSAAEDGDYARSNNIVSQNQWHHIAATFDQGNTSIYIDGQLDSVSTMSVSSIMNDDHPLIIGGYWEYCGTDSFVSCLDGTIDDVRIYDKALSDEEIQQLYNGGGIVDPNLIGYLDFDEGAGQIAYDLSGNGNDGHLGNDPCNVDLSDPVWIESEVPYCWYYVDGTDGNDLNGGLTAETAFKTIQKGIDSAEDGFAVLVYPGVYTETETLGLDFDGKAITVRSIAEPAVLEVPDYYAVSFTHGEDANSVFENFIIRNSYAGFIFVIASPTISNITVVDNENGALGDGAANPDISNSIFWNNTNGDLYDCQARYSYIQDEVEPVSCWKFDEGSGTDANDSMGSNDGMLVGDPNWVAGKIGSYALEFDGIDDYVRVDDDPSLDFAAGEDFSVLMWIKTNSADTQYVLDKYKQSDHCGYRLLLYSGQLRFMTNSSGLPEALAMHSGGYDDGQWHHVVGVRDQSAGKIYLYVDGAEVANANESSRTLANSGYLYIGVKYGGSSSNFDGTVDDVHIYDRALSESEIRELYQKGLIGYSYGPLFADANNGDYHLLSERGRYRPSTDEWILDKVTSPCVDGGDPAVNPASERMPNGGRINMGAYGGTEQASMNEWPIAEDNNRDGVVDFTDFAKLAEKWLQKLEWVE